jgi:hypothetical protein
MTEHTPVSQASIEGAPISVELLQEEGLSTLELQPPKLEVGLFNRLSSSWTTGIAVGAAAIALATPAFEEQPAYASSTKTATIGMPFTGKWAYNQNVNPDSEGKYNDSTSSHPSVHHTPGHGDWSTDLYANEEGKEVKLKASSSGELTFSWGNADTSCGEARRVNVKVDNTTVGVIYLAHLSEAAATSSPPTAGMTLGKVKEIYKEDKICNPGRHIHVEFDNTSNHSCYSDHGKPGVSVGEGNSIGILGSSNTGAQQKCESAPESSTPTTLPRPAAATFNGNLNVFTRGGDGQIYTQYWNGTNWTGFSSIGGDMVSDPAVTVNGSALNVFALNKDGQVYTKYNDGSGWTGWASLGGQTMRGNPKVIQYGAELDVFALGTDNHPYKNTWQPESGWGGWTSLGNYMDSSPAPVVYNGELDVIMRGGDNVIYKDTWNGNSWGGFAAVGGCCLAGNPDAIQYGNQLDIWSNAPAPANGLWKNTWNGSGWSGWVSMGSGLAGNPDVIQYGNDLNVFARGGDGQVYTRYWSADNQSWSAWASTDPNKAVAGDPTVVQSGTELDILVTGTDGKTYKNTKQQGGNWGGFSVLPG